MKKALIVGIDYYQNFNSLHGCVNDANSVNEVLLRHENGAPNFDVHLQIAGDESSSITRRGLKKSITNLFSDKVEIALFYFAGHGYISSSGGFLATSEIQHGDEGFPMDELLRVANESEANHKIIILDCCHSGYAGNMPELNNHAVLAEGITILTAADSKQYASEANGSGVFTSLLVDALQGAAADLIGQITPGSVYAHVDQSLGSWAQRPLFKTNVRKFTTLRKTKPSIEPEDLRKLILLFPDKNSAFQLDPTYEASYPGRIAENEQTLDLLQKLNRKNLVVPLKEKHLYHAALCRDSCVLTPLGKHYWNLVRKNRI